MRVTSDRPNMTRRTFMQVSAAGTLGAVLPIAGCWGERARRGCFKAKRPNIVFVIADDMGWADVGYHGSQIETPNIDRLARQAVRFSRHYVMPTCTPTRVGLMTGHYPSRYGVTSPAYGKIFNDDTVTLPAALRQAGYYTCISGKWHMGSPPQWTPRKYGFDSSYGYFHGQIDPYTHHYKTGVRSWHRNDEYVEEEGHATDLITDEAVRVIASKPDKPFFLYVAYSVPHFPLDEPPEWTARYAERIEEPSRRWFAASITHMDHGIGRIVEALDRGGLRKNTLIVFVSDNGGQKSWHNKTQYKGRYADKPHTVLGDNRPLRGWKGDVYEGGIRVPALASWPSVLKAGELKEPVHIVDWMPTLCGLAGYSPDGDLQWDGANVWPLLLGDTTAAKPRSFYWKTSKCSAVRLGDWKLILKKGNSDPELYNLASGPYETKNLARRHPEHFSQLKALLSEYSAKDR